MENCLLVSSIVEMKISFNSKLFVSKVFEFDQYYSVINSFEETLVI